MSRSRNADDFRQKYLQIRFQYENTYREQIKSIRDLYEQKLGSSSSLVDDCLEFHFREYFVNSFLHSLNWQLNSQDKLPNLIPESPIDSVSRGTKRRLDYLGIERETLRPLLIVETKHPKSPLPQRNSSSDREAFDQFVIDAVSAVIADGLKGAGLKGKWNDWLNDLRAYVLDVMEKSQTIPKRVILTNGYWLILFVNPADSFLPSGSCEAKHIFVFTYEDSGSNKHDDFASRYYQIFELLEHQQVLGETPPLNVGELSFHLSHQEVSGAIHGLRLMYIENPSLYFAPSPIIQVSPVIFLHSKQGSWLQVESGKEETVPHLYEHLKDHLNKVEKESNQLLKEIEERLGGDLTLYTLKWHYSNDEMFEALKGITKLKSGGHYDEYLIITGDCTHYIKPEPSVIDCSYHSWTYSSKQGCAHPQLVSIQRRSTDPRSFFISEEKHHCANNKVSAAKSSQITPSNREKCGARSGKDYDAFCEIWPFEKYLCCRTCAFEEICTKKAIFILPCKKHEQL